MTELNFLKNRLKVWPWKRYFYKRLKVQFETTHDWDTECDPYIWNRRMESFKVFETDLLLSNNESLVI